MTISLLASTYVDLPQYTTLTPSLNITVPEGTELLEIQMGITGYNWAQLVSIQINGSATGIVQQATSLDNFALASNRHWTLINPTVGVNTISFVFGGGSDATGGCIHAKCWGGGVDTTTPVSAVGSNHFGSFPVGTSPIATTIVCATGGVLSGLTMSVDVQPIDGTGQTVDGTAQNGHSSSHKSSSNYSATFSGSPTNGMWQTVIAIKAAPVADTTPPVLSSPTGAATGTSTSSGSVTTDEAGGTLYRLASTNATETSTTIIAANLTTTVTATGVQNVTFSGLAPAGTYYNHFVQKDAATTPNTSNVVHSASYTTAATNAVPTFAGTIANITGTGGVAISASDVHALFTDTDALTYAASPAGTAWPSGLIINATTGIITGTVATSTTTGLKVRATDTASQTVDSNAFSITLSAPASTVTSVSVTPSTATIAGGTTQDFDATVNGTNSPSQTVNWTTTLGTVNSSGLVTAPATTGSVQTGTVTATSAQDGTKFGTATFTVPALTGATFTMTLPGKIGTGTMAGAKRLGVAFRAAVYNKANDTLVGTKTGLVTDASTGLATFSVVGAVAGTEYLVKVTSDADNHDVGIFWSTPA